MSPIERARSLAMGNGEKYHLAALLWRGPQLIRIGVNSSKTHPAFQRVTEYGTSASMHAEMDALRFAEPGDRLDVIRWGKSGNRMMAKPCKYCDLLIQAKSVYVRFTNPVGQWETL